ncbi:MAG TPA: hypothetical protein DIW47_06005 [Bacteroidetes bacterium]|nr:hypothetical protein [Bacteroidota bacterium]
MKPFFSLFFLVCGFSLQAQNDLVVHEWGTFTTLSCSNGKQYKEPLHSKEKLPDFVYNQRYKFEYFDTKNEVWRNSFANMFDANMGMETPVLYFYSTNAVNFELSVEFNNGTISQFYPNPTKTESFISPTVNFQLDGHTGYATWRGFVHPKASTVQPTYPDEEVNAIWRHPREVAANIVDVNGKREKYLFYRGLGHYDCPITVENALNGDVKITNTMNEMLPFYICTELIDGVVQVHAYGSLLKGTCNSFNRSEKLNVDAKELMTKALISQGLYEDEARAMIATWDESYFRSTGMKVFWIVPNSIIDQLLPLNINPQPKEVKRAFFGRIEVMEADFELYVKGLFSSSYDLFSYEKNKYRDDPYKIQRIDIAQHYVKNLEISKELYSCDDKLSIEDKLLFEFKLFPNPTKGDMRINANFDLNLVTELYVANQLGKVVFEKTLTQEEIDSQQALLLLADLPAGMYIVYLQVGEAILAEKLILQNQ